MLRARFRDGMIELGLTRDPIRRAALRGVDIALLEENLKLTPTQRIRNLEARIAFLEELRQMHTLEEMPPSE